MKTKYLSILILAILIVFAGCKKKETEPDPVPYTKFSVDGVSKEYNDHTNFNKICIDVYFCGSFWETNGDETKNTIQLGFPSFVKTGETYITTEGGGGARFIYTDANGNVYNTEFGGTITYHVDLWEGNGGWAKGTFSGTVVNENDPDNDSVAIQSGYFQGKIWYVD